jgi:DNA-binding NarL/FixJ family response regulator
MEMVKDLPIKQRKAGRPRAIPEDMEPVVVELYDKGYGYRAIARILNTSDYGINAHFSSIRKTLIRLGKVTGK